MNIRKLVSVAVWLAFVAACVLVINKRGANKRKSVLFINADREQSTTMNAMRSTELSLVSSLRLEIIDSLGERWLGNANYPKYIGPDGLHPNDAGHDYLSARVVAGLKTLGITPV